MREKTKLDASWENVEVAVVSGHRWISGYRTQDNGVFNEFA